MAHPETGTDIPANTTDIATDIVIVGGGPAGLQAALTVGRVHREAVLLDDGRYRNAAVAHMHNLIGADGTTPEEFRSRARRELAAYETIRLLNEGASGIVAAEGGFVTTLAGGGVVRSRAVVLATGVRDELPPVPGLAQVWGGRVAHCPFCHAHEFAGGRFGILGTATATHLSRMLAPVAGSVVVLPLEGDEADGRPVDQPTVVGMRDTGAALEVTLADDSVEVVDVAFVAPALRQRSDLPALLGLEPNPSGCVRVDEFQRTSVPGVLAAGDMAHLPAYPMPMASVASATAAGQLAASAAIMHLLSM
ncbi:MAG: NAD(P)/FAD-dependent oxidoreductase [Dermatophilaceae bacterium]